MWKNKITGNKWTGIKINRREPFNHSKLATSYIYTEGNIFPAGSVYQRKESHDNPK